MREKNPRDMTGGCSRGPSCLEADVLIIGGGTAGCYAARELGSHRQLSVLLVDKASIERSGCLAAGVNAINAYITKGRTPEFYADYALDDAAGIARYDLLISMSQRLNQAAYALEDEGLVFLKDEQGEYVERGARNVRINGENIKPLLARAAKRQPNVRVLEHVNITDLLLEGNRCRGAVGFSVRERVSYTIHSKATIIATGGAAGLYRPNNPGFSRHKMWYSPFNTGAGYAMGIRAGAEMTSFEMRFIALRCKDTIAPTGTIAQGVRAKQVNGRGEVYENKYGLSTSERVWGTVEENRAGRGPCYLRTTSIGDQAERNLYRAYLNMAPAQTLRWIEAGVGPNGHDVEIEGTEPYIVGGHTASGYWVDEGRRTTVAGLYAAGDVAGGAPQKYVTGALAEASIAVDSIVSDFEGGTIPSATNISTSLQEAELLEGYKRHFANPACLVDVEQLEEAMQKAMDQYAGGISTGYRYNELQLAEADEIIRDLERQAETLPATDTYDLLRIYELKERLCVCRVLIAHLGARKETRWHAFAENTDHPECDRAYELYVNSRLVDGELKIILRDLVRKGERLEHFDR